MFTSTTTTPTFSEIVAADELICLYVIPVLACLGVCGNVVVLLAWSRESCFRPATFLTKCLAASDILFCTMKAVRVLTLPFAKVIVGIFQALDIFSSFVSVNTTLAVVFSRWLAVTRPLHVHRLLTRTRTLAGYGLLLLWCSLLAIPWTLIREGVIDDLNSSTKSAIEMSLALVGYVIPVLLLVVLNVCLVRVLCRRGRSAVSSSLNQRAARARADQLTRLLGAVVCVGVTTVLTYPVGFVARVLVDTHQLICDNACDNFRLEVHTLLTTFNSSINVVYYLLFVKQFGELLCKMISMCLSYFRPNKEQQHTLETVT